MVIRTAEISDAPRLLEIYSPYVLNTAISFEYEPPSLAEFEGRIRKVKENGFPYLVAEKDEKIIGYAYAGQFQSRKAYHISAEASIYLDSEHRRAGIGRTLYARLEELLREKGTHNLYALIAYTPREDLYLTKDSILFHERMGFVLCGHLRECGEKFGRYYDMCFMEKTLDSHDRSRLSPSAFDKTNL